MPPDRVHAASLLGQKLVNARKGDTVAVGTIEYVVEDVQSKYVVAHTTVLRDFPFAFPDHPGLQRMEFKQDDISPFLAALDRRHDFAGAALRLYREKSITLGMLSIILNGTVLDIWLSLAETGAERLLASEGSSQEVEREEIAIAATDQVVIEPTALLTAARIGILDLLGRRFDKIYVAQHVLDDFLLAETKSEFRSTSNSWAGKVDGRYVINQHLDQNYLDKRHTILREILQFITTKATIVPCQMLLDYSAEKFADHEKALGSGALASMLIAKERCLPLYSDDQVFRALARAEHAVPGSGRNVCSWTQEGEASFHATNSLKDFPRLYETTTTLCKWTASIYFGCSPSTHWKFPRKSCAGWTNFAIPNAHWHRL